ncbi:MAG: adenylate/guanylate cyclase domain-containing protein, partial [Balneolaceae bacterium]
MSTFIKLNKATVALLVFLGIVITIFTLQSVGFFQPVEESLLDQKFRTFERETASDNIRLLMIDQKSLDAFVGNHGIYWPWPREVYSTVHNYLVAKKARLVVYDILFDQPDFSRNGISGEMSDQSLEQMLGTYQNGILAAQTTKADSVKQIPSIAGFSRHLTQTSDQNLYSVSNLPIPRFLSTARGLGSVAIPTENEALIRSVPLFFNVSEDQALPSLGMAAYLGLKNGEYLTDSKENYLTVDSLDIPLSSDGKYLVNWYKKGGTTDGTFKNHSFYSIFEAALQFQMTGVPRNDQFVDLEDKLVFLGANAAGLSDIKSTPMSPFEPFPGVEIHATVTNNLLEGDFITYIPNAVKTLLLLSLIAAILGLIFWAPSKINISATVLILAGILVIGLFLFSAYRIWFPTAEIFLASLLTVVAGFTTKYVSEDAQKRALRSAFDLYLQKELVEQIVDQPELLKLGGDKKELTVLFSDLAGFTSISEDIEPEELVAFLNEYLSEMTSIVFKNRGTLDKYIGDAIMAFWGAPVPAEDHAYLACKCVLEMEEKMAELQQKWTKEGKPAPHVRYGINSGAMVVGNMGSDDRFSYTVLGDNVNLG